jgi:hypothetical protein
MKNAHLRLGKMTFSKKVGSSFTNFSVHMDRFIGERSSDELPRAHLISVVGGDAQIAAVSAIISEQESFTVQGPGLASLHANMGKDAQCFRASIPLSTSKRPLRHLIAVSRELETQGAVNGRTLLVDSTPNYLWASMVHIFGLPAVPEWASWFYQKLDDNLAVSPLHGLGCRPALVTGTKEEFLRWLSEGVKKGEIELPPQNGPTVWRCWSLKEILLPVTDDPADLNTPTS